VTWRPFREDEGPRRLRSSLDRYARRIGAAEASSLGAVFARWEEIVGAGVAAHAEPLSLVDGSLVVGVDDPAWATQIRFLGNDILRRLEEVAGAGVASRVEVRVKGSKRGRGGTPLVN
jgi:predicted nucleic acid-binding Zn ribbon protein